MPSVTNVSDDDLNLPALGLVVTAGATVEVSDETADELDGHPHFSVDRAAPQPKATVDVRAVDTPSKQGKE